MRDERRPGLDGPGRMVKSRGLDGKISYLTKIWGFAKGLYFLRDFDHFPDFIERPGEYIWIIFPASLRIIYFF